MPKIRVILKQLFVLPFGTISAGTSTVFVLRVNFGATTERFRVVYLGIDYFCRQQKHGYSYAEYFHVGR